MESHFPCRKPVIGCRLRFERTAADGVVVNAGRLNALMEPPFLKVPAAERNIVVIGTEDNLVAFTDDTVFIKTGVAGRLFAAPADCFDFADLIGDFHQAFAARKEAVAEVCAEAVAENRDVVLIYNIGKKINLLFGRELNLINDNRAVSGHNGGILAETFQKRLDQLTGILQTDPGTDNVISIAGVDSRLQNQRLLFALFIVIGDHQRICGLG